MSTNQYLVNLASKLVLSDDEETAIKISIATLRTHLSNWKHIDSVKRHKYFGSYDRGTILPRKYDKDSDIDYMIQFDDINKSKPQTYLNWLKEFAYTYYCQSEIHQDFPTIALELNHIRFELVPAVQNSWNTTLQIPTSNIPYLNWIPTNPEHLAMQEIKANKMNKDLIKPTIRLLKLWNVRRGKFILSCKLEEFISNLAYWGCNSLEDYFYFAASNLIFPGLSTANQIKLSSLRSTVTKIKQYKSQKNEYLAGYLLTKLFE